MSRRMQQGRQPEGLILFAFLALMVALLEPIYSRVFRVGFLKSFSLAIGTGVVVLVVWLCVLHFCDERIDGDMRGGRS